MTLLKELTTVTPLSKTLAAILLIILPFFCFRLGMQYQAYVDQTKQRLEQPTLVTYSTPTQNPQNYPQPTQTPTPTPVEWSSDVTTWKTYTNAAYGYSVQYPSQWKGPQDAKENIPTVDSAIALSQLEAHTTRAIKGYNTMVVISVSTLKTSFAEYVQSHSATLPLNATSTPITVAGIQGVRWTYQGEGTSTEIAISKLGKIYTITIGYLESEPPVFNQIISTFRFTQ